MDIADGLGAALAVRVGTAQQAASLSALKQNTDAQAQLVATVLQAVGGSPVNPNLGQNLNTVA